MLPGHGRGTPGGGRERNQARSLPQLSAPVATAGHLIALKTLAARNQDLTDLGSLIPAVDRQAAARLGSPQPRASVNTYRNYGYLLGGCFL
jgi:hypothetical protein